jgi:hypothetical protein
MAPQKIRWRRCHRATLARQSQYRPYINPRRSETMSPTCRSFALQVPTLQETPSLTWAVAIVLPKNRPALPAQRKNRRPPEPSYAVAIAHQIQRFAVRRNTSILAHVVLIAGMHWSHRLDRKIMPAKRRRSHSSPATTGYTHHVVIAPRARIKKYQLRPLSLHSYTTTPRSFSVLITFSIFRRTSGRAFTGTSCASSTATTRP